MEESIKTKFESLSKDPFFLESVLECKSSEQVREKFAEKDIEISIEHANYIFNAKNEEVQSEIDIEQLENVSGGFGAYIFVLGTIVFITALHKYKRAKS